MIKICLVDDHDLIRKGFKQMLSQFKDIAVVDEFGLGSELLDSLETSDWEVLVLDISLPDHCGVDLIEEVKSVKPDLPILILSMHHEDRYGYRSYQAGASGYLTKDTDLKQLVEAIRTLASGKKYISESMMDKIISLMRTSKKEVTHENLSKREFQVICLLAQGKRPSEIAKELSLNVKTISTYRERILEKLNLKNNSDIFHYCNENGLILR